MSVDTDTLVQTIERQVPATAPLIADHIDFYEELLPHVLFGDLTRWTQDEATRDPDSPALTQLLQVLDVAYGEGDDDVRNVLNVSFLENLDAGSPVLALLGPNLRVMAAELGMLEKKDGRVTAPSMKTIFRHVLDVFAGDPQFKRSHRDVGEEWVDLLYCLGVPSVGMTAWATIGMYAGETGNAVGDKPLRVELVSICDAAVSDYGNMLASCAFNVLTGEHGIKPGTVYPDIISQYLPNATMKHMFFVPVFSFDGPSNLEIDGSVVTWLQAVPVADSEFRYLRRNGVDALETLLEERDVDVADLDRAPAV